MPKSVLITKKDVAETEITFSCPVCSETVIEIYDNYCSVCGTKLEWDEKEWQS